MARQPGKKDACAVVLLVGASLLVGLSYLISQAARWVL